MSSVFVAILLAQTNPPAYSGRIQGGWEYVWVSYGITWAALTLYALSLWLRSRASRETSKG
jgi:hypothetical protein